MDLKGKLQEWVAQDIQNAWQPLRTDIDSIVRCVENEAGNGKFQRQIDPSTGTATCTFKPAYPLERIRAVSSNVHARNELIRRLKTSGIEVNVSRLDSGELLFIVPIPS